MPDELPDEISTVGVIGLGQMGGPIARHLVDAGFVVVGNDLDPQRAAAAARTGVEVVDSPRRVAERAAVVLTSLPSPGALLAVLSEPDRGLLAVAFRGSVLIELSTLDLDTKHEAARLVADAGGSALDCPISGTAVQAEHRDVAVYASGDRQVVERCAAVLEAFSRTHFTVGGFGSGSVLKYAANLLVGVHNAAAAEALVLATKGGVDPALALEVLSAGAGTSRMLEVRGPDIVSGDYRPGSATGRTYQKDLGIIARFAADAACPTPMFAVAAQLHTAAFARGHLDDDTSSVAAVLRELAGLGSGPLVAEDGPSRTPTDRHGEGQ